MRESLAGAVEGRGNAGPHVHPPGALSLVAATHRVLSATLGDMGGTGGDEPSREDVRSELIRQVAILQLRLATATRNEEAVSFLRGQVDGTARTAHLLGLIDREAMNDYLDAAAAAADS